MVARMDSEMFPRELFTPQPDVSDSDDVLLALETARALETQGEIREAVRWLRRAADEAEQQGNDERVLALARAAADLTNTLVAAPPAAEVPTMPPPSMYPATTPPPDAIEATIPPPSSLPTTLPPVAAASEASAPSDPSPLASDPPPLASHTAELSRVSDMPLTERSMRIGAIRVAIALGSVRGTKSFSVERLESGQLAPPGTTEAMLVFTSEIEDVSELEPDQPAAINSAAR
jgi:hypothetical protein